MSQVKLTKAQIVGILEDFEAAIDAMPDDVRHRAIELLIPSGDSKFAGKRAARGYVISGTRTIHISPAVAKGRERTSSGWIAPYIETTDPRRGTIVHEMGHIVDYLKGSTGTSLGDSDPTEIKFWRDQMAVQEGAKYAKTKTVEGYAEMFAQWHHGGPGSSKAADAYAARYGW
jgi:hypothetical protein